MASESTTGAVFDGDISFGPSGEKNTHATYDTRSLPKDRLAKFCSCPGSTIIASDLDPQNIQAIHAARIDTELAAILPFLPPAK
ncbi:uncharacterized protein F4812DRAFT_457686 [Daldinia caldariorum]|uniref:uncharacterized protein n=1 Tax=Daldinia caldariorum TaxID=326644 RepID=UPI0020073802|nr:uncharacterized protein F4812DRAFT_457686 [Daldinia caldariorum]KAI1469141.1 hypothetical protein F4812DRAFT_457686 [Daldinia caldariorum]